MNSNARLRVGPEQLIGALVPAPLPRPRPAPAPLPVLPARRVPIATGTPVLDMARLDRSGRLSARILLRALGWQPGHRVDIDIIDTAMVITAAASGQHIVGSRGEIALPASARELCGIMPGPPVVLAAYPPLDMLVIHPASTVARLISEFHSRLAGSHHGS